MRPFVGILRELPGEQPVEHLWKLRPPLADARRRLTRVRVECRGLRSPWEDHGPGQAFEDHRGEGVAVGGGYGFISADDLWGEVGDRAHQPAGGGDTRRAAGSGQPEVAEVGVVRVADEHVLGLHVAVHEPGGVRCIERVADLAQQSEGAAGVQGALAHQLGEGRASHQPHRQVEAVLRLARLVHRDDMGVLQRGLQPALAPEASGELRIVAQAARDQLERDLPAVLEVPGAVHGPHAAATENALDSVLAND